MNTLLFMEAKVKKKMNLPNRIPKKCLQILFHYWIKKLPPSSPPPDKPEEKRMKAILSGDPKQKLLFYFTIV